MNDEVFIKTLKDPQSDFSAALVYADWLEEQGDPRAAFLRLAYNLWHGPQQLTEMSRKLDPAWVETIRERFQIRHDGTISKDRQVDLRAATVVSLDVVRRVIALARLPNHEAEPRIHRLLGDQNELSIRSSSELDEAAATNVAHLPSRTDVERERLVAAMNRLREAIMRVRTGIRDRDRSALFEGRQLVGYANMLGAHDSAEVVMPLRGELMDIQAESKGGRRRGRSMV